MSFDNSCIYYILLVTKTGRQKEKSILKSPFQEVEVLPGSLFVLKTRDHSERTCLFELLDSDNIEVECTHDEVDGLQFDELALLFAIPICSERTVVYQDKDWLREGAFLVTGFTLILKIVIW